VRLTLLFFAGCAAHPPAPPPPAALPPEPPPHPAVVGVDHPDLQALLRDHWEATMAASPLWASRLGDRRFEASLGDWSLEADDARIAADRDLLERADALPDDLGEADATTLELFVASLESSVRGAEACRFSTWSFSPRGNPLVTFNELPTYHPLGDEDGAANLLARYRAMPAALADAVEALRAGAERGRFNNAETTHRTLEMLRGQLDQPLEEWPLLDPLEDERLAELPEAVRADFEAELRRLVEAEIQPALAAYADFLEQTVLPRARTGGDVGLAGLDLGADCYAARVAAFTTLERGPAEIHQLGLEQLAAIHDEFRVIGARALGVGDLAAIFERLRDDPALYFTTEEEVEAAAVDGLEAARAAMPAYFGRLPLADCVVERIPDYQAPFTTIAYYQRPHADGSKPGEYFVNTYAPETRPRHEARVLALHEAIPGHHLQIAIAQELGDLPAFRRYMGMTAFVEGWALYTERLAEEMGLYRDDLDRLGMLSFAAWRASRLVVDTGVHHMGWSRAEAEAFLLENTPLAENNIVNEVDRYISWPGQALAYMTGQIVIRELRAEAEAQLGEGFSVADFHDVVLGGGAVTLPVLQRRVRAWIEEAL